MKGSQILDAGLSLRRCSQKTLIPSRAEGLRNELQDTDSGKERNNSAYMHLAHFDNDGSASHLPALRRLIIRGGTESAHQDTTEQEIWSAVFTTTG